MLERLHKVLARAGVAALRPAEEMIMAGHVTVNGRVVRELGARVDPEVDVIAVDGELIELRQPSDPFHYVAVHKPAGVISTARDTHDRPTVLGLVPSNARLFPVGRLDSDSEGLILLTDDGDMAFRLTHPRFEVEKEYRVLLDRTPQTDDLRRWREGVELEGVPTMPAWIEVLERTADGTWLRVVMREGRKRQIREVARLLGYRVLRLVRVREGPITLGDLSPGAWRELSPSEVQALRAHTQHIPSRAAEEERERRMAQRDRPEGRRLRIIRGGGRSTSSEAERVDEAMPPAGTGPTEDYPHRARSYASPDEQRRGQPSNAERRPVGRQGNAGQSGGRTGQRGTRRPLDSHAEQARRQPRSPESRADATGRRNRDVSYGGSAYRDRGPQRGYPDRGGPRRTPDRGYDPRTGSRSSTAPERDGNRRDYGNQRDTGNQRTPESRPYGDRRSYGGQRPSGTRPTGERRDFSNRRDYGNQRAPTSRPSGERRDYGNQRDTSNQRGFGNRRQPDGGQGRSFDRSEGMRDDRRNRPPRPGDAARNRGGYVRPEGERRRADDRNSGARQPNERRDSSASGNRRERSPDAGSRSFGAGRAGPARRPGGSAGQGRNSRSGTAPRRGGPPSGNSRSVPNRSRSGRPGERKRQDEE